MNQYKTVGPVFLNLVLFCFDLLLLTVEIKLRLFL